MAFTRSRRRIWLLALANAAIAVGVFAVLVVSPAPVHFPSTHWEAVLLAAGAVVVLVSNGVVAALVAASAVQRGRAAAAESRALQDARALEHFHVATDDGVVGLVDEVIARRDGDPVGLLVAEGWFGARRWFIPLDEIRSVSDEAREVRIFERPAPTRERADAAGAARR